MGIEPTWSAWKAEVLPLNYTRINSVAQPFWRQGKPRSEKSPESQVEGRTEECRCLESCLVVEIHPVEIRCQPRPEPATRHLLEKAGSYHPRHCHGCLLSLEWQHRLQALLHGRLHPLTPPHPDRLLRSADQHPVALCIELSYHHLRFWPLYEVLLDPIIIGKYKYLIEIYRLYGNICIFAPD